MRIPHGTINVNQLHDELLVAFPEGRGTLFPDGVYRNPPLMVYSTPDTITLLYPDNWATPTISSVVAAHQPQDPYPPPAKARSSASKKLKLLGFTDEEIQEVLR